jgi:multidrug efflux pump
MLEVVIDPLRLEAYNVTAGDLINAVVNNNQLIAAGEVETERRRLLRSRSRPPSTRPRDVYNLPVKVNGDRVVTLGDLADIRLTFEDRDRHRALQRRTTVALQVVKRKGFNIIDTAALVRETVERSAPAGRRSCSAACASHLANDQSTRSTTWSPA